MHFNHIFFFFICIHFVVRIDIVCTELYTSTTHLTQLLSTEEALVKELRHYLNNEYRRLDHIKKFIHVFDEEIKEIKDKQQQYFGHPVNTYLFIKHFTSAWPTVQQQLPSNFSEYLNDRWTLPLQEDAKGSAIALMRLQDTYQLTSSQIVQGDWNPKYRSKKLNALQCFELGQVAMHVKDYYHGLMWLQEALDQLDANAQDDSVKRVDVLNSLIVATTAQKNVEHAMALNEEILKIAPGNMEARSRLRQLQEKTNKITPKSDQENKNKYMIDNPRPQKSEGFAEYERLCRLNESRTIASDTSRLFCRYRHNNHPYLFLQPVKEEQLSENPPIFVFHDVVSDGKIDKMVAMATERLQRAKVVSLTDIGDQYADYRISKNAWIWDQQSDTIARFSYFIEAVTNLNIAASEPLQLANYGIGGHYEPHYDFFNKTVSYVAENDDRIATWLTYLSDVEQGGGTAFPKVGVHVKARKGSAVFWYNIRASGVVDEKTQHAGCPVLIGNKWIANKWIRSIGQEFYRPCSLDPNL